MSVIAEHGAVTTVVAHHEDILGESPFWDWRTGHLYWVDLRRPALYRLHAATGAAASWTMPSFIGCVVGNGAGGVLVGLVDGIYAFAPESAELKLLLPLEADIAEHRLNDAKCDAHGALWISTMWDFGRHPTGSLYRVDPALDVTVVRRDISVPNAISFSPDGGTLYFTDSRIGTLEKGTLDAARTQVARWDTILAADARPGSPDGATVDAEGFIWHARFQGGAVVRVASDGRIDREITLPVSRPTSCAFGGPDLRTLYITTGRQGMTPEQLAAEPLAGAMFAVDVGVQGRREGLFGDR